MDKDALIERYVDIGLQLEDVVFEACDCDLHLELKVRYFGNGSHYVYQCNNCGEQRGGSLKKTEALHLLNGLTPKEFDPSIEELSRQTYKIELDKYRALLDERRKIEAQYLGIACLPLDEHKIKLDDYKSKLNELVDEMTEEVGSSMASRVLINATVQLKKAEYLKKENETDRFESEFELKTWLVKFLSQDFDLYPEVSGVHLFEKVNVRIDFVAVPKRHLVDDGFDPTPFGIEVKYFRQENQFTHKTSRAFWQTISYNDSEFFFHGQNMKLKYSVLFSNLSFDNELALVRNYGADVENDLMEWKGMLHLANHANVGQLAINGDKNSCDGWYLKFAGGRYFSKLTKDGEVHYSLSNKNVINKVRVGNF
ncbi:MAG: hypothetical protein R3328_06030 [Planococcaceae bacterium]|nr:hypothetical protein [Planococcaceae bacterium]